MDTNNVKHRGKKPHHKPENKQKAWLSRKAFTCFSKKATELTKRSCSGKLFQIVVATD